MKKAISLFALLFLLFSMLPALSYGINGTDTRMLSQPAISAGHIAFIYAEDLWVAGTDGSQPRRLTVDEGIESNPVFSPDGTMIAFSAQYDGNTNVYVIPVEGGIPRRLTWHPGADLVRGFTPDGNSILFTSARASWNNRYSQLFTVPVKGGPITQLEIPNANYAVYSPDGKWMAYTPLGDAFRQWKHYRGGSIATIYIFSFADKSVIKVPQPEGGCNDTGPIWMNNTICFRSDRNGEFNLFSYDIASKTVKQLTDYKDFPIINASGGNGKLIFEQAGYLHTMDASGASTTNGSASANTSASAKKLTIGIGADLLELRSRFVKGPRYIRSAGISPSGSRAVLTFGAISSPYPQKKATTAT
jgi:tricorn protease